jgi:hypothetical protein
MISLSSHTHFSLLTEDNGAYHYQNLGQPSCE